METPQKPDLLATFIEHDGKRHQIFTGWDEGRVYKIGDKLNWWPLMDRVGVGIDGVYSVFGNGEGGAYAVAVSNGVVVEVVSTNPSRSNVGPDRFEPLFHTLHQELEAKWPKYAPLRECWPEDLWRAKADREQIMKKTFRRIG